MNEDIPKREPEYVAEPLKTRSNRKWLIILLVLFIAGAGIAYAVFGNVKPADDANNTEQVVSQETPAQKIEPTLKSEVLLSGHGNIWDLEFLDSDKLIYTVRSGEIWGFSKSSGEKWLISKPSIRAEGEGGLLGIALDNKFSESKRAYICYNALGTPRTVRVASFSLSEDFRTISDFKEIITDIESQAGRHSGCRLAVDKEGLLWVGTGDSALRSAPQNPKSLAGKVLRVDSEGRAVAGNMTEPFDSRIYNYGHRNIQGLVLFDKPVANGAVGLTAEHGSGVDDELNWLMPGNFGWDPAGSKPGYDESVPMTDKTKYPDAVEAVWSSGNPTIAVSGVSLLVAEHWSAWQGRAVMAVLKDKHLLLVEFSQDGRALSEKELLKNEFGRIRTVREGPDGNLYLTTDNGKDDKIIVVKPVTTF